MTKFGAPGPWAPRRKKISSAFAEEHLPSLILYREDTWLEPRWLVVVEISATLFQPARSGSHLYSAPLHPVRSRTLSSRSYSPLVGLATPLLPCFPHLHPYYITRMGICQEVFNIFFKSFGRPQLRSHILSPLDTLIISQTFRLVKGFFMADFSPP